MTIPQALITSGVNTVIKSERKFEFHPEFKDWKGVQYTEETTKDGKRHYTIDGVAYPSITTILSYDPKKIETLKRWRARVGEKEANKISRGATSRGTAMHKLCEDYLVKGEAELKSLRDRENFFKVKKHLEENVGLLYCVEEALYSTSLGVAGRTDMIGEWAGEPAVIDFKTSGKAKYRKHISQYFIQGAAYSVMFEEMTGIVVPRIVIVMATEELNEAQIFVEPVANWMQPLYDAIKIYRESVNNVQKANS